MLNGDSTRTVAPHSEDEDDHTLAHTVALANCRILNIKTPKHKICDVGEYILDIIIIKF